MTGNRRELGESFALGPWRVSRAGYGAMQVAGDGVFGPPRDLGEALRVLRAAGDEQERRALQDDEMIGERVAHRGTGHQCLTFC